MNLNKYINKHIVNWSIEALLTLRAIFFIGNNYNCPCCGWNLRLFTHGGSSLRARPLGYCPRCNSKARHRRWWLFLQQNTNLFSDRLRLFHFSPNYCLSRRFITFPNIEYMGGDLNNHRNIRIKMDLASSPIQSNVFDAIICMHVLEHIQDDRKAIREIYRTLKPGGWACISVPIRLDQKTYEDPSITSPEERERAFGETVHVRFYGYDIKDRLENAGFNVRFFPGTEVNSIDRIKYGLRDDENIFYCTKS